MNAEFQRIAKRDEAFLSERCKEIEENNRMRKSRDLFKKIRDTKGTFRLKLKKLGKTTRPFTYDLNQIPYDYIVQVTNRL